MCTLAETKHRKSEIYRFHIKNTLTMYVNYTKVKSVTRRPKDV